MQKHAHMRRKPVRARFVARVRENMLCTRVCAQIFTKLFLVALYYTYLELRISKFHKDPSFCCGDIGKIRLLFVYLFDFLFILLIFKLEPQIPPKFEKYIKLIESFKKCNFKMLGPYQSIIISINSIVVSLD